MSGKLEEASAARAVVLADESGGSWFEKLAAVANQIGIGKEITRDKLAVSATYLRWISTGTIKCVESGGHRRPNGPAMVGRGIFISMEQVQGAMYRHGTDLGEVERVVMRQVHPWLPSFNEEFTNAVPLTRNSGHCAQKRHSGGFEENHQTHDSEQAASERWARGFNCNRSCVRTNHRA